MRELLGTVDTVPPVIHMVNDTLRVLYNEPVDASLAPCPSAAAFDPEGGAACWAYAWDAVDGDVSSTLKISQMNTGACKRAAHDPERDDPPRGMNRITLLACWFLEFC